MKTNMNQILRPEDRLGHSDLVVTGGRLTG